MGPTGILKNKRLSVYLEQFLELPATCRKLAIFTYNHNNPYNHFGLRLRSLKHYLERNVREDA